MMRHLLFNPFQKIAGWKALLLGIIIMVATAVIANFSHCHFDGVLDAHAGKILPPQYYFYEFLISWGLTVVIFYLAGIIASSTKTRLVDMAGTTALARYPLIFVALLSFTLPGLKFSPDTGLPHLSVGLIIVAILMATGVIWSIVLLYRAFTVSAHVKGNKAVWGFFIALVIAEILSKIAFHFLYHNF